MPINLPVNGDVPFFSFQATLEAVTYTVQLRWNVRAQAWFATVLNEPGDTVLIGDTRLVANWPMNFYFTGRTPPGCLVVIDTSGAGEDPSLDGLGDRWQIWYVSSAELGTGTLLESFLRALG